MKKKQNLIIFSLVLIFFLLNVFYISQNNRIPFIGDDARFLMETANLTDFVKEGDFKGFAEKWSNLFMVDTNSVPRTPLFTLVSIIPFLIFGVSTKVALVTNAFVFAINSFLLYALVREIFQNKKNNEVLATFAVILFNVFPGYFGFARLYMSETLQTTIILLSTLLVLKWKDKKCTYEYLILGIIAALGMLLRFILPMYLIVQLLVFFYYQVKVKYTKKQWFSNACLLLIGFAPLLLTWYYKNFVAYYEFSKYTSQGALAEVVSLGPVYSPITWLKYWKVIVLWHFSWPIMLFAVVSIVLGFLFERAKIKQFKKELTFLILIPLPALLTTTLSVNKTARYFLPVEVFIIILISFFFIIFLEWTLNHTKKKQLKNVFIALILTLLFIFYPFFQSVTTSFPMLPLTGLIETTRKPLIVDESLAVYEYILDIIEKEGISNAVYILPEQVKLNDAALQWVGREKGLKINAIGEFSPHHSFEEGKAKVDKTQLLFIDVDAKIDSRYEEKYKELLEYALNDNNFVKLDKKDFINGCNILVLKKVYLYAEY